MQRPLSFRFSAFTSLTSCFLLLALGCMLSSCWFNANYQGKGVLRLQGEWKADSVAMEKKLLTYSLYNFKFDCDSFRVQINTFTRVNYGDDSCRKAGHWSEYAKGNYDVKGDTLHLKGFFCLPNYRLKMEGDCFRVGVYEEYFLIHQKDSILKLQPVTSIIPFTVHLVKRTDCHPKPL